MDKPATCQECGSIIFGENREPFCIQCLYRLALESSATATEPTTQSNAGENSAPASLGRVLPEAGSTLGDYTLLRLLGQGGMGSVFEAEHLPTGRRVAIKFLRQNLYSPRGRELFRREGRLAASLSHPNSVFVYAAEEIDGQPIIVMELIRGGTLKEHVREHGPMNVKAALDAILQVMAGLEAAEAAGLLHRDIKPSNCFIDDDLVKIGDFGISIDTLTQHPTWMTLSGGIAGTPAFASPEQLRGDALDVRSEIYSVAATLFYLLTGRPAFDANDLSDALTAATNQPPPSASAVRRDIPAGLSRIIQRAMQKAPERRFASYDELRSALLRFHPSSYETASPLVRSFAGMIDAVILFCGVILLTGGLLVWLSASGVESNQSRIWLLAHVLIFLYYLVSESNWAASPGKLICRLRIVDSQPRRWRAWRVFLRTFIFVAFEHGFEHLPALNLTGWSASALETIQAYVPFLLCFSTIRKANGYAAVHDLVTGIRVVQRRRASVTPPSSRTTQQPLETQGEPIGPFVLLEPLRRATNEELWLGFDRLLRRKVWIHRIAAAGIDVAHARDGTKAHGRLRWLCGRADLHGRWDAYEYREGVPLDDLLDKPQSWTRVRRWLLDLSEPLAEWPTHPSCSTPILQLDRVWITHDDRAVWLDFPGPMSNGPKTEFNLNSRNEPESTPDAAAAGTTFLYEVAHHALSGNAISGADNLKGLTLPVHARELLERLHAGQGLETVLADLSSSMTRVTEVSPLRRAAVILGVVLPALMITVFMLVIAVIAQRAALQPDMPSPSWQIAAHLFAGALLTTGFACLIGTALWRRGLILRLCGLVVVQNDGAPATLGRRLGRVVLTWCPFLLVPLFGFMFGLSLEQVNLLCLLIVGYGAAWAIACPSRGLAERLSNTLIVPE
jgi:eukaryotic-like serine/threonine-protein kinase